VTVSEVALDYSLVAPAEMGRALALEVSLLDLYTRSVPVAWDPSQVGIAEGAAVGMDSVVITTPPPPVIVPDPWTVPDVPAPSAYGLRYEVWACRPVTHQQLAQFVTAKVGPYGESWDGAQADVTVSAWDPAWDLVADLDAFEVMIGLAGQASPEWCGICDQPIDIVGDEVRLPLAGPMNLLDQNGLGAVGQPDLYHHAGRFNQGSADGWAKVDEPENGLESPLLAVGHSTFDPWEGTGCLEVQGVGWFAGPWVRLAGHPGRVRHPQGSAFLKCPSGALGIETQVKDGDGYLRPDFARANARSVDADRGWQGLVTTKGWLPGEGGLVRIAGYVASKDKCYVDFARITWGTLSGSTVPLPLSSYPGIVLGDAQNTAIGGHAYGIAVSVDSTVDARARLAWAHHDNHQVGEILRGIAEMYGGPDIWMDHRWTLHVARRRGTIRADVMLDDSTVLVPGWAHDPGARITELIGLTEYGTGATRATVGATMATSGYHRRSTTQAPAGMDYDTAREWIAGLAGPAGQPQRTATLDVTWATACALEVGDTVQVAMSVGRLAWSGWVRVYRRIKDPDTMTGRIDVGLDGMF
jgi:hypothetical protein